MKKLLTQFVKYPFYGGMFILVVILLGVISLQKMKKSTMPLVESKEVTVSVSYPGATPKEMDEGVTTLIENSIRGVVGIKEFSSRSRENSATVTITSLNGYNMDELLSDVKNAVDGISNFPSAAERPIVSKGRSMDLAMFVSLYSKGDDSILALNSMANRIEDDWLASGLMSKITINGVPSNLELVTEVDETQLRRYGLTLSEVKEAISSNNLDFTGGTVRNPREQIKVIARTKSISPDDIKNIVIRGNDAGGIVRIGDVASVKLQAPEDPSNGYVDKKPAVTFMVSRLANEDLQSISNYVNKYIKDFNKKNTDYQLMVKMDFLERIDGQLDILTSNGLLGVSLVILMLTLLLNFRLSLWVAWGIPSAFLGMFIVAQIHGLTLNMVSLFGMILIIGILVDDGVVIGENIFTHFERGKSPRLAAIDGTLEVLPAVLTSVLTTIIAFVPLLFIEGNMEMMYDMGYVVIVCLLVSMIEAIFVLPGHLANAKVLKPINGKSWYGKVRLKLESGIIYIKEKLYRPLLESILMHKTLTVLCVSSFVILTFALVASNVITYTFFPSTPSDSFTVDLVLKPGVSESITKDKIFAIEDSIAVVNKELMKKTGDKTPYITSMESRVGSAFSRTETGTNAAQIRVFLSTSTDWDESITDQVLKREIAKKVGTIPEAYKFAVGASNRFGAPVSISLLGYDPDELSLAKEELENELKKMPALFNVTDNSQLGSQELRLTLKPQAYALGCTTSSVLSQVRNGFYGGLAQRIQDGKDEIWVYVRLAHKDRESIGGLENMTIHTSKGDYPLGTIVNITSARSVSTINHYNGQREVRVEAYQKDKSQSVPIILDYIEKNILTKISNDYPNISFVYQGQQKDTSEQMGSLGLYFGLAFLLMVLTVMIYFKSYNQGMMVILMIPLGVAGSILGHGIHGEPLSMMSLWGMVALSGVVINDAIVFMSSYNSNLEAGMTVHDSILEAGISRFRPILLTTITTVAGLMPLILESNPDAAMLVPMSISLAYGILFGTFFILILLPVFIKANNSILYRWGKITLRSKHPDLVVTREMVEPAVRYLKVAQRLEENIIEEEEEIKK